jgi:hypothetical protein
LITLKSLYHQLQSSQFPFIKYQIQGDIIFLRSLRVSLRCSYCFKTIQVSSSSSSSKSFSQFPILGTSCNYSCKNCSHSICSYSIDWICSVAFDDGTGECNLEIEGEDLIDVIFLSTGHSLQYGNSHSIRDKQLMEERRSILEAWKKIKEKIQNEVLREGSFVYDPSNTMEIYGDRRESRMDMEVVIEKEEDDDHDETTNRIGIWEKILDETQSQSQSANQLLTLFLKTIKYHIKYTVIISLHPQTLIQYRRLIETKFKSHSKIKVLQWNHDRPYQSAYSTFPTHSLMKLDGICHALKAWTLEDTELSALELLQLLKQKL